jgi:hypothetical protein
MGISMVSSHGKAIMSTVVKETYCKDGMRQPRRDSGADTDFSVFLNVDEKRVE